MVTFVGGVGTVVGPILGAIFFVVIRDVLATNLTNFHQVIFGCVVYSRRIDFTRRLYGARWDRLHARITKT
ncbi:MAG: hypothetical protein H6633_21715 [Anaerolineales bacterium]|nr:hypothetical protein [Anaerolineales bacterium]